MLYLMVILISFDPSDPGWMQSIWTGSICNQGGIIGAQISDFLFFYCGILAYTIPIIVLFYTGIILIKKTKINIFRHFMILVLTFVLFIIFCMLTSFIIADIFYFSSGGIIGHILLDIIKINYNNVLYIILLILSIITVGVLCFFYNFLISCIRIRFDKIAYFINSTYIFFFKKKNQNRRLYKQASFNARISPLVFSAQKNTLLQNVTYQSSNISKKKQTSYLSASSQLTHKLNNAMNNDVFNKIQFIPSTNNNTFSQDDNIIKFWINQLRSNINHLKDNSFHIKYTNSYNFTNKKVNTTNKNMKKNQNHELFRGVSKKRITKNNLLSLQNVYQSCIDNRNLFQQKKIIPMNYDKNQLQCTFKMHDCSVKLDTPKKLHNCYNTALVLPDIGLLVASTKQNIMDYTKLKQHSQSIEQKLLEYRITANVAAITPGPIITRFDLNLSAGIKSSKITNLSRDLARSLSVSSVRVIEVIPGTPYVGLEIPNEKRDLVYLKDIIDSDKFQKNNSPLTLVLGKDISGQPVIEDLRYMPHLLIAGTTGSGKSIGINVMIIGILYKSTPEDVRFIMIDPKILELSVYSNIPHLLKDIVTNTQDVESILQWCIEEMERRYKLMSTIGVRNLESYNRKIMQSNFKQDQMYCTERLFSKKYIDNINLFYKKSKKLPYIVIIIDEFSDLMITTGKKVEMLIVRLTQKARAAGIHMILATQRPSVDVITGVIKANIPARIAFTVSSNIDSRTILGQSGAESLLGMGDMLYLPANSSIPIRIHGAHITDKEICTVVNFWKKQTSF